MHIAILTQYYRPETGAPQNRLADLAARIAARGHRVTVLTAMPNYPSGTVRAEYRRRWAVDGTVDGIDVRRSWIHGHRGRGTVHQLATYGTFAATSLVRGMRGLGAVDVVLWESPPLFLAPTAEALARRWGARLVMNVSDLWPESAIELGMIDRGRLADGFFALARRAYRRSDLVVGQTVGILDGIEAVAPGTPTTLFPNGVDCERFRPRQRSAAMADELGLPDAQKVVAYAGNFGRAQALGQVVEMARTLLRDRSDVTVLMIGDGPVKDHVVAEAHDLDPARLLVRPSVEASRMQDLLSVIDVAIVPLADQPLLEGARPSKMFELMASGVPFVFCGRGEGADIAEQSGGAVVVDPEAPAQLAAAVGGLLDLGPEAGDAMRRRARDWVRANLDRATLADGVIDALEDLAAQPKARR